jgi:hypothetical protein
VADPEPGRNFSVDAQPTAVHGAVVRAAQDHQIVRIIAATLRSQLQMVNIDVSCIAATWNDAATSISPKDFATDRRRRLLCGALTLRATWSHARSTTPLRVSVALREFVVGARVGVALREFVVGARVGPREFVAVTRLGMDFRKFVGNAGVTVWGASGGTVRVRDWEFLGVAVTHLDDCRIELDQFAIRVLKAAPTVLALGHHHLVTGAAGIARATQHLTRHREQGRVIIQPVGAALLKDSHCFAKRRQRFGADF